MNQPVEPSVQPIAAPLPVTVYWRPGCGFCSRLRRDLAASGLTYSEINIWEEPEAAAFVRQHASGNETVPTVAIGDRAFVNPTADDVLELAGFASSEPERGGLLSRWLR